MRDRTVLQALILKGIAFFQQAYDTGDPLLCDDCYDDYLDMCKEVEYNPHIKRPDITNYYENERYETTKAD